MSPTERPAFPCVTLSLLAALALVITGCNKPPAGTISNSPTAGTPVEPPPRVIDMTRGPADGQTTNYFDIDPCADQLHDIAGMIVLYYRSKGRLPERISELNLPASTFACPSSHQSYVYVPGGLVLGNDLGAGRLVLYDATPAHSTPRGPSRWGILFSPAKGNKPLSTDVITIPESSMAGYVPAPPSACRPACRNSTITDRYGPGRTT